MIINPNGINNQDAYKLLIGAIVPRPIAWVSTMDTNGRLNVAPFSYFSPVASNPMTLLFCPGWSSARGRMKDTYYNVLDVPEFVVNIVDEHTKEAMNQTAAECEPDVDEFVLAGLTPVPSQLIRVPRIGEAPVAFECVVQQIVMVNEGPGGGAVVFGEVKSVYVRDDLLDNGRILPERLQPIGRMAGGAYARMTELFEMSRPVK